MRRKHIRPQTREAYQATVQRRLLDLLLAVAPDAPVPLRLLQDTLATESVTDGPICSAADMWSVFDNVALVPYALDAALGVVERLPEIERDVFRDTITVSTSAQEGLRRHAAAFERAHATEHYANDHVSAALSLTVEMYSAASFHPDGDADGYSHDQFALVVPHLLHLLEAECGDPDAGWGPVQSLATLWLLNAHGVVASNDVDDETERVMAYCAPRYRGWNAAFAVAMLTQTVEEMLAAGWEEAPTVGSRALAMAEDMRQRLADPDERTYHAAAIAAVRRKLAAQ